MCLGSISSCHSPHHASSNSWKVSRHERPRAGAVDWAGRIVPVDHESGRGGRLRPYLDELRVNWRPLTGAFIGLSGGLMMASYVVGIMAPYLIGEFGWPKSQFALVSGLGLVSV